MNFDKLKGKMVEKRYTQKKMAGELGITMQSLNSKLNNRSKFTLDEVAKITTILKTNPMEIFFENNIPNKQQ